jgi:hypothetical protein
MRSTWRAEAPARHHMLHLSATRCERKPGLSESSDSVKSFGEVCHFGARLHSVVFMLKLNSVKLYNYVL